MWQVKGWLLAAGGCVLAVLSGCTPPSAEECSLSRRPTFQVGDMVETEARRSVTTSVWTTDGKLVQDQHSTRSARLRQSVMATNSAGRVAKFLQYLDGAVQRESSTQPSRFAFSKTVHLKTVCAVASRDDGTFEGDPATVASPDMASLSSLQVELVKALLLGHRRFLAFPEGLAGLMPAEPVRIGHSWEPSRQAIDRWARSDPAGQRIGSRVQTARFRLASVLDGVARVEAELQLAARITGVEVRPAVTATYWIDTRTGRWLNASQKVSVAFRHEGLLHRAATETTTVVRFRPGDGRPPTVPARLHGLGWPRPAKDTNSYKDRENGFSLDVPPGFARQEAAGEGSGAVTFASLEGGRVTVEITPLRQPVSFEELLPAILANLKNSLAGYQLTDRDQVTLPDNVPGALFIWKLTGGEAPLTVVAMAAVHERRLVRLTAVAPDDAGAADRMRTMARTLRVFSPVASGVE